MAAVRERERGSGKIQSDCERKSCLIWYNLSLCKITLGSYFVIYKYQETIHNISKTSLDFIIPSTHNNNFHTDCKIEECSLYVFSNDKSSHLQINNEGDNSKIKKNDYKKQTIQIDWNKYLKQSNNDVDLYIFSGYIHKGMFFYQEENLVMKVKLIF